MDRLAEAARTMLDRLDVIDARDEHTMEAAVYKVIREVATAFHLDPKLLWAEAVKVERDPVERHREVIGYNWQPNLR
jgi:hypothetical protein